MNHSRKKIELLFVGEESCSQTNTMPNNKHSRKNNTKQVKQVAEKPMATATAPANNDDDDWGSGSILIKSNASSRNSTRSNKSKKSESEPAPPPPTPEWELVGMTEEDYKALCERVVKQMRESQLETYKQNMLAEWDSISFWERRIESLECSRERYNKKAGWSSSDIADVDEIDAEIKECEDHITRIEEMDDFDEYQYEYENEISVY